MSKHIRRSLLILLVTCSLIGCTSWADYACGPARWGGYDCPSPQKMRAERR